MTRASDMTTSGPVRQILLVDDEVMILRALERGLRGQFGVTTALGPRQALEHLTARRFDAVVSDERMPERSGSDLLREIRERWPETIRVLMTGYTNIETTIEAVNRAHIAAFLKKPLRPAEIAHALEDAFAAQTTEVQRHTLTTELERKNRELERALRLLQMTDDEQKRTLARTNLRLVEAAHRDALTGLPNRRGFLHRVACALRQAGPGATYAVLFADVDRFKAYNDRFGHGAGDLLLKGVARTLEQTLRAEGGDLVGRLGGEEFVVLVPGVGRGPAVSIAERLRRAVGATTAATVSIGVAMGPEHGLRLADVMAAADSAMYRAKQHGRDRVEAAPQAFVHRAPLAEEARPASA